MKSQHSSVNLTKLLEDLAPNFTQDHREQIFSKSFHKQHHAIRICLKLAGVPIVKNRVDLGDIRAKGIVRTLDVGPGIGQLPIAMKRLGFHPDCLFSPQDFPPPPQFVLNGIGIYGCDTYTEPFPMADNTYGLVTMQDVIEHFHHSPKNCLKEILRVMGHVPSSGVRVRHPVDVV